MEVYDDPSYSKEGVQWSLDEIEGEVWVVIAGTNLREFDDLKANADWKQREWAGVGSLHLGYYLYACVISQYLYSMNINVHGFTGHSLGGAVAHILGLMFKKEAVSFGSPRWGDPEAAREAKRLGHKRFTARGDKIPHLPFFIMPVRWIWLIPVWWHIYKHGGKHIKIGERKWFWHHSKVEYNKAMDQWAA